MNFYDSDYWDEEDEDDGYPYGAPDEEESDGYFDDDYDDYVSDWEYHRSLMNRFERAWSDFTFWVHRTRLYRKWDEWRWTRRHQNETDIPF